MDIASMPTDGQLALPLPDQATLAAIGEFWVRFSHLEAMVDVSIGVLLHICYLPASSVTANLNMRARLDMVASLLAMEEMKNPGVAVIKEAQSLLAEISSLNDERSRLAHGKFVPKSETASWEIIKMRASKKMLSVAVVDLDIGQLRQLSARAYDLLDRYGSCIFTIAGDEFDLKDFVLGDWEDIFQKLLKDKK
jgi:hypothetical protein